MAASVIIKNKDQQVKPIEKLFYAYAPLIACTLLIPATNIFSSIALLAVARVDTLLKQQRAKMYENYCDSDSDSDSDSNHETYSPIIAYIGTFFFCFMIFYGIPAATTMLHAQLGISELLIKLILISWSLNVSSNLSGYDNISRLKYLLMIPYDLISLNQIMLITIASTFAITTLQLPTISALIFGYLAINLISSAIFLPMQLLEILHPSQKEEYTDIILGSVAKRILQIHEDKSAVRTIMETLFLQLDIINHLIFAPTNHGEVTSKLDIALSAIPFIMFALSGMPILIPSIVPWKIALALSGASRIGIHHKCFNLAKNSILYKQRAEFTDLCINDDKDIIKEIISEQTKLCLIQTPIP